MITSQDMRKLEDAAENAGVSKMKLMENAGKGVYGILKKRLDLSKKTAVIFCGKGNNAGDGCVLARYLSKECFVFVLLFADQDELKAEAAANFVRIHNQKDTIQVMHPKDIHDEAIQRIQRKIGKEHLVIVDALLGTGIKGKVREPIRSAITFFNAMRGYKVVLDVPSGIHPDTGEKAEVYVKNPDIICTFHDKKPGIAKEENVVVIDIGIPKELTK